MDAHLFIPCLVEHVLPRVGEATLRVLDRAGVRPVLPPGQTCCGQFAYKRGRPDLARPLAQRFITLFEQAQAIVCPSASCTAMARRYPELFQADDPWRRRAERVAAKIFEFGEFLVDRLGRPDIGSRFPARAVLHGSCQATRVLGVGDRTERLLAAVDGLTLLPLAHPEACCGFGGAFSLEYPEVGQAILDQKVEDVLSTGAEAVITAEPSCLLNIGSALAKRGARVRALHLAEVLAGGEA